MLYHYKVKQLFLAPEVIVDKGQVITLLLSYIAGTRSRIAFAGEYPAGSLLYLLLGSCALLFVLFLHRHGAKIKLKV